METAQYSLQNLTLRKDSVTFQPETYSYDKPGASRNVTTYATPDEIIKMNDEAARLETFKNWPIEKTDINTNLMALSGFYYINLGDKVRCNFCYLALSKWTPFDDIIETHLKESPSCPLLRRRVTSNIPINSDEMDAKLPPANYDVTGLNEYTDDDNKDNDLEIKYPEFRYPQARLKSFDNWPTGLNQKPEDLAAAGFFYTGIGDRVICFSCNLGLNKWDPADIPFEEHARWGINCNYILKTKGEFYCHFIKEKYENTNKNCEEVNNENENETITETEEVCIDKVCKICLDKQSDTVFLPCGHIVACGQCGFVLNTCPLCRKKIDTKHLVYYG